MTRKIKCLIKNKMMIASISVLSIATIASCSKSSSSNDGAKFVGTWTGTTILTFTSNGTVFHDTGTNSNVVFLVGSDNNHVNELDTLGTDSAACTKIFTNVYTVSGSNITLPSQTLTDNCGRSQTMGVTGSISGTTLTLNVTGTINGIPITEVFTGTKK